MRLFTLFLLLIAPFQPCIAGSGSCQEALSACDLLVKAQDVQIAHLKDSVKQLEDKLTEETSSPLLPWWGWTLIGVAGGFAVKGALK